jgi:hypothetical protein
LEHVNRCLFKGTKGFKGKDEMKDESANSTGANQVPDEQSTLSGQLSKGTEVLLPVVRSTQLTSQATTDFLGTLTDEAVAATLSAVKLTPTYLAPTGWPSVFPVNCPPFESTDCNGTVIRVLYAAVPSSADFASWMDDNHPDLKKLCQSCGLSVHLHIDHLIAAAKRIPSLRGRHYASLHLTASDGKLLNTPSRNSPEHHTWWKSVACVTPEKRCKVLGLLPT